MLFLNTKSHLISSDPRQTTGSWKNILLKNLVSFVESRLMCFVLPWWLRSTAHKTIMKASQRPQGHQKSARPQRFSYCGTWRSYTTWRSPRECFLPPIISGLLRPAKIGLASKGMTHGMTKLLCLSVRLGLYPTDICWLRLIQALEKPGIRVRHRWLFPVQFCLARDSEGEWKKLFPNLHPVFTDSEI